MFFERKTFFSRCELNADVCVPSRLLLSSSSSYTPLLSTTNILAVQLSLAGTEDPAHAVQSKGSQCLFKPNERGDPVLWLRQRRHAIICTRHRFHSFQFSSKLFIITKCSRLVSATSCRLIFNFFHV